MTRHSLLRHICAASSALALIGGCLAFAGERPVSAAAGEDTQPSIDYVFEIEPGEDLDHWIDFALGEADVSRLDRQSRIVYKYEEAINGAWLKLTQAEARDIDEITGMTGVRALTRSWNLTAQWFADDVIVAGTDGRVPAWPEQIIPAGIQRVDGGHAVDYSDVHVGIVDTDIDRFHPDLNVVGGFDCTFEGHPDDWGLGHEMHSTHVAGTIGALDNSQGVTGVAPGASLHGYRVLGDGGSGSYAAVLCGIDRGMVDDVDIINMSLGGGNDQSVCDSWDSMHTAVCNATADGIAVIVAAGNDTTDSLFKSPANYPEAYTVSALATFGSERPGTNPPPLGGLNYPQADNELAFFSNNGGLVDVIQPGVLVLSTLPGSTYGIASGTSMAAPHFSGLAVAAIACGLSVDDLIDYAHEYNSAWGGDVDYDHEPLAVLPSGC